MTSLQPPTDATTLLEQGERHFLQGDLLRAEDTFREAAKLDPEAADSWSNLGVALFHLERPEDARTAFGRALSLEPEHDAAREGLAHVDTVDAAAPDAPPTTDLLLMPAFDDEASLAEHLGRIAWYVGPWIDDIGALRIVVAPDLGTPDLLDRIATSTPDHLDPAVPDLVRALAQRTELIVDHDASALDHAFSTSSRILVWDSARWHRLTTTLRAAGATRQLPPTIDIDPFAGTARMHEIPRVVSTVFSREASAAGPARFRNALETLADHKPTDICYVFGGGPTIRSAVDRDLSDGFSIVCNRFVWDDALTDHVDPTFLAFMDASCVGPSRAGTMFREHLRTWLEGGACRFVLTFDVFGPWVEFMLPPELHDRVIAAPAQAVDFPATRFNADLRSAWWMPDAHNVITSVCLPVAATVAQEIRLLGLDGVRPDKVYESWGRSWEKDAESEAESVPDDPFLAALRRTHPWRHNWVSPDYQDTYRDNLEESLRRIFTQLEQAGTRITCVTPSWMEVMRDRGGASTPA